MSSNVYDVVVVGGGSNSLTTAAFLAKIGKKVLVLEKNAVCGGGVMSMSPAPGFINDPHAVAMVTAVANPVIANDELELHSRFGLEWAWADTPFSTVFDDGTGLQTHHNLDRTCESIARFSHKDAETYRRFVAECREFLPLLLKGFYTPPLPFGGFIALLEQNAKGRRLVTAMLESCADAVEMFESPELKMHILKWAGELMVHPETKGTGIVPYLLMGMSHDFRMGAVIGGTGNLARALERAVVHHAGEIRTECEVVKINSSGGRVTGVTLASGEVVLARDAVVANIHPWDLKEFLGEGVDTELAETARRVKLSSHGAINQQIALTEPPIWKAGPEYAPSMLVECLQRDMTGMREKFDEYKYGRISRKHLSPLIAVQSNHDKSRAPEGQATLYLYHFAPLELEKTGLAGWDAIKDEVGGWIFDEMCKYTTNIDRSKILGWHIETPLDHHRHSKMMRNGDIFGIGTFTSQFFGRRPIPELAQYKVPGLDGFYLAGPTQHPGGTVTLGGRATAMKMMMDWKIDLRSAFKVI